ncbi:MAG: DNA polymerase I [Candidatus Moranbacteria bacterium CG10_big_fil_rev_8_21_14_0_10_35_21]|nr:MAG: DNA polymerase I [Candidatus Moranbacteria bacterium CG10_big_fil_rev_8_21_14_0_10_35_21]PJA88327.1 MAG: DNA polymerase I [Candidatus Moranbacteria bacterium CG_4_9_14_3_um_filter_36_9]
MSEKPKKLVLIDGNALIHRAYHALPPLTTKTGELVNAVYGFSSILLKVLNDLKPDYIAASFDLAGPTFRHKEYKEYKATRVKAPDDLYAQIDRVKEVVRAFNIPIFEKEGFEADDVIGTMAGQADKVETIIVTGDLDLLQLVKPKVKIYALRRGMSDIVIYDEKAVEERYGLKPEQMIDYKGLRGDPSDNIPGVKGIGEKTATELLKKYGTIENVYKNLSEIKGAVKDKLERDKAQAILSKHLSEIVTNVPLTIDLEKAVMKDFDRKKIVELFQELNFFSLIKRIPTNSSENGVHPVNSLAEGESATLAQINGVNDFKFEVIDFKDKEKIDFLLAQEKLAFARKTFGEKMEGVAFAWKTGRINYFKYTKENKESIKNILENKEIEKIGYDVKEDLKILEKNGIKISGKLTDVMLEAYVLNPGGKNDLEKLVLAELGEEITEEKKTGQMGLQIMIENPSADGGEKLCRRADYIFKLNQIFSEKIIKISKKQGEKNNLKTVLENIELPLLPILAKMEMNGIKLNTIIFQGISETITKKIKLLEEKIYKLSGEEFNINSPKQLAEILFVKMKISTDNIKKNKTGFSTASAELDKLRKDNKIIEFIEEYRELFKLKTTYLDALPNLVDKNSRLHTTFNQAVTATGRLSSSEPNLQNIPIKTDLGQLLRTAFVAEDGYKLVSADYSQIDLRVVAHVSEDKKMMEAFRKGEDIHRATAAEINKVTPSQVTEKMRSSAKALNFGVIYGMSVFGFSQSAGIEREDARKFIDAYMEKFSGIAQYMRDTKEFAKKEGFVETEMGRRRNLQEINSPNFQVQNAAERMAINMPIQGLAADIVKVAMIKVAEEFQNNPEVKMLLQVHDEIILEVKEPARNATPARSGAASSGEHSVAGGEYAEEVAKKIKTIMENAYKLKVPLVVDVKIGDNWGEI